MRFGSKGALFATSALVILCGCGDTVTVSSGGSSTGSGGGAGGGIPSCYTPCSELPCDPVTLSDISPEVVIADPIGFGPVVTRNSIVWGVKDKGQPGWHLYRSDLCGQQITLIASEPAEDIREFSLDRTAPGGDEAALLLTMGDSPNSGRLLRLTDESNTVEVLASEIASPRDLTTTSEAFLFLSALDIVSVSRASGLKSTLYSDNDLWGGIAVTDSGSLLWGAKNALRQASGGATSDVASVAGFVDAVEVAGDTTYFLVLDEEDSGENALRVTSGQGSTLLVRGNIHTRFTVSDTSIYLLNSTDATEVDAIAIYDRGGNQESSILVQGISVTGKPSIGPGGVLVWLSPSGGLRVVGPYRR